MLVCIVEEGEYEDRRIAGVYTTKALAERAKELIATENEILIFDTDTLPELGECPLDERPWEVYMNKVGGARNARIVRRVSVVGFKETDITKAVPFEGLDHIFRVYAKYQDQAVKRADKCRELLIQVGKWRA